MTYLDHLNRFNKWLETNSLPTNSQLLFYKILHLFNRAGWPDSISLDNLRLALLLDISCGKTAVRARDRLVEAGFLHLQKGRKGTPNRYSLRAFPAPSLPASEKVRKKTEKDTYSDTSSPIPEGISPGAAERVSPDVPENVPVTVPENVPPSVRHTKTKTQIQNQTQKRDFCGAAAPFSLPLRNGEDYAVTQEQCREWSALYPRTDVPQQLRNMLGWLNSHPGRRKTRQGMAAFITHWLQTEEAAPAGRGWGTGWPAAGRGGGRSAAVRVYEETEGSL